jgi:hypothetical protein
MVVFRRAVVILVTGTLSYAGATVAQTGPNGEPSGRVGRLAFLQGSVSFHDNEQTDWAPALVNTPVTSGDAIWTEPNAKSEISIAGTRVRMDGATQLDMLALDDTQTRMELEQGRVDIKTFTYDTKQPYEIVTPRGVISLQQQGDYYVEAGTTQDPTRLGVRQGAAQIKTANGQVLAVRAGEVGEVSGDGSAPQLHTIKTAPPPMPTYWAERDRQVVYEQPPQYLSASVTGYEDLNHYGTWSNDPEYGQVWSARSVPNGWSPYSTGRWTYEQTYGWTWVDEQPWGFAPYHYGRWAQRNDRWFWVPPERQQRAVYAPALVAFIGGVELGVAIGGQNQAPVGWFPLGPREVYVPPYTSNRDYYRRLNMNARVQQQVLDDRWQRAQRREAIAENNQQFALMNRRFATVVPSEDFARSRPVQRSAIRVSADKIASAPVAFVSAPPSPTVSIRAAQPPGSNNPDPKNAARPNDGRPGDGRNDARNDGRPNDPNARGPANGQGQAGMPTTQTRLGNMQAIKAEPEREKAPGPKFVSRGSQPGADQSKAALPQLAPRNEAVAPVKIEGDRKPADGRPDQPAEANAPGAKPTINVPGAPQRPGEPNRSERPGQPPQANAPAIVPPGTPPKTGEPNRTEQRPGQPPQPGQANLPPVRDRNDQRPDAPRTGDAQRNEPNRAEPPKPPQTQAVPQPPRQGEAPKPPQAQAVPQPPHAAEPPKPPQAQAAPQPQRQAEPPKPQQAEPPKPQQIQQQQPQRQAAPPAPPAPPQAHAPSPPQQQAQQPQQAPQQQQQAQQPAQQKGGGNQKDDKK